MVKPTRLFSFMGYCLYFGVSNFNKLTNISKKCKTFQDRQDMSTQEWIIMGNFKL